jgi:hypothetical protein
VNRCGSSEASRRRVLNVLYCNLRRLRPLAVHVKYSGRASLSLQVTSSTVERSLVVFAFLCIYKFSRKSHSRRANNCTIVMSMYTSGRLAYSIAKTPLVTERLVQIRAARWWWTSSYQFSGPYDPTDVYRPQQHIPRLASTCQDVRHDLGNTSCSLNDVSPNQVHTHIIKDLSSSAYYLFHRAYTQNLKLSHIQSYIEPGLAWAEPPAKAVHEECPTT